MLLYSWDVLAENLKSFLAATVRFVLSKRVFRPGFRPIHIAVLVNMHLCKCIRVLAVLSTSHLMNPVCNGLNFSKIKFQYIYIAVRYRCPWPQIRFLMLTARFHFCYRRNKEGLPSLVTFRIDLREQTVKYLLRLTYTINKLKAFRDLQCIHAYICIQLIGNTQFQELVDPLT
jgi:hypothetical protein